MQHQGHAHRLEAAPGQFRAMRGGRARHALAGHMREADAGTLEQLAFFEHAPDAAAAEGLTRRLLPGIANEGLAVKRFEACNDRLLQSGQVVFDARAIDLHERGQTACAYESAPAGGATRNTSSKVVTPAATLSAPEIRSGFMPSL